MEKPQWNELFNRENEPTEIQIKEFINTPLFGDLDEHLRQTYKVEPKVEYSSCAMDGGMWKGWNIKPRFSRNVKSLIECNNAGLVINNARQLWNCVNTLDWGVYHLGLRGKHAYQCFSGRLRV